MRDARLCEDCLTETCLPNLAVDLPAHTTGSHEHDVIFLVGMFGTLFARWMLNDVYLGVG